MIKAGGGGKKKSSLTFNYFCLCVWVIKIQAIKLRSGFPMQWSTTRPEASAARRGAFSAQASLWGAARGCCGARRVVSVELRHRARAAQPRGHHSALSSEPRCDGTKLSCGAVTVRKCEFFLRCEGHLRRVVYCRRVLPHQVERLLKLDCFTLQVNLK